VIVGISGKRGVGKTLAAKHLEKRYGLIRVSFADELRRLSRVLMPFTEAHFTDIAKKEAPFDKHDWTPRDFLIGFGEFMRFHDPDYWCDQVFDRLDKNKNYVIDDMRYQNEFDAVKQNGGLCVRINRYAHQNPFGADLDIDSERSLDSAVFDFTVPDCRNTTQGDLLKEMDNFRAALVPL